MMWPIRSVLSAVESVLDRVLCVLGALLFSQVPEFIQQYLQRLGGHVDEARRQLERLRTAAEQSGLTLDQLSAHAAANSDPAVVRLGSVVGQAAGRVDSLAAAEQAIRGASAFARPFVFMRELDPAIARSTLAVFKPAMPTTLEGLAYAIFGMLALLAIYHFGLKTPIRRAWRRRRLTPASPGI